MGDPWSGTVSPEWWNKSVWLKDAFTRFGEPSTKRSYEEAATKFMQLGEGETADTVWTLHLARLPKNERTAEIERRYKGEQLNALRRFIALREVLQIQTEHRLQRGNLVAFGENIRKNEANDGPREWISPPSWFDKLVPDWDGSTARGAGGADVTVRRIRVVDIGEHVAVSSDATSGEALMDAPILPADVTAEEAIIRLASGSAFPWNDEAEATLRDIIVAKWGADIFNDYPPMDKRGGEQKHPWVRACRDSGSEARPRVEALAERRALSLPALESALCADLKPLYEMRGRASDALDAIMADDLKIRDTIILINRSLADGLIDVFGRPTRPTPDQLGQGAMKIPRSFFQYEWNTITLEGRACCDCAASGEQAEYSRLKWGEWEELRFFPDDIEKLIAAGDQNGLGSESSEIAAGSILHGGVRAYWTWNQTIAWIMFRDPGFVGKVLGSEGLQFKLWISQRTQIGRPPIVASLGDARHELVECAKATNIKVLGCRSGATDVETIPPWDRCRGAISEGDGPPVLKIGNEEYSDSDLRILNHGPGIVWRDLLLPRDTIVKHWPPNGIKIAQSDVSRPAPDGTIFIDEAIERLQVRLGGISDGRAVKMVLDVLASTEVRTRLRRNETYQPKKYSLHADSWKGSYIDLEEFRNGRGGVRLNGDVYHLHRVLISEDDFNDWLNQIAPASTVVRCQWLPSRANSVLFGTYWTPPTLSDQ